MEAAVSPETPSATPAVKTSINLMVTVCLLWEATTAVETVSRPKTWKCRAVFPAETVMRYRMGDSLEKRLL